MSILSLKGEERAVIIVPESSINAGYNSVAFKIQSFIKCSSPKEKMTGHFNPKITYAKAVMVSRVITL